MRGDVVETGPDVKIKKERKESMLDWSKKKEPAI